MPQAIKNLRESRGKRLVALLLLALLILGWVVFFFSVNLIYLEAMKYLTTAVLPTIVALFLGDAAADVFRINWKHNSSPRGDSYEHGENPYHTIPADELHTIRRSQAAESP